MKKSIQRFAAAAMAVITVVSLAACGGSGSNSTTAAAAKPDAAAPAAASGDEKTVTFQVTNTHSGAPIQDATMDMLIEKAAEYSGGTIKGSKIAAGSLGGEREETEMIQLGTLECGLISDMGIDSAIGGLGWAWLPFMLPTYEMVDEYYINGWIGEELTKQMAAQGIVRVAATENAYRECGNVKKPIKSMEDFNGMKIRVPETKACQDFYTAIGAIPAAIATSETLAALEQGTVDGVDNSISNMESMGVMERLKYITMLNYMYSGASIVCSEDFWNSMSASQQEAFKKAAEEAGAYMRTEMRAAQDEILAKYDFEVETIDPESDFYKQLNEKASGLWENYKSEYPAEIMDRIMADFAQ